MKMFDNLSSGKKTFIQAVWILMLLGVLLAAGVFFYISKFLLPDTGELENPKYEIASQVIANDGSELGKVFTTNRVWLTYKELNPNIVNALLSSEDERFYSHNGVDIKGVARAVAFGGKRGGGSTITQQLAKQFFTDYAKSTPKRVWQKLKEWVIAVEFERRYTKEEIIAMYLNKFDFYYNAIGIGTASKIYFGKNQTDLKADEAAILIGLLQNPYFFNPKSNPENCTNKRNLILGQMVKNGHITEAEYQKCLNKKIDMSKFASEDHFTGLAPYFRVELTKWVKALLKEDQYKAPDGTNYDINTSGLKIFTTIDPNIQKHAEEAARAHMANLQQKYFKVWSGLDPWTYNADAGQKQARMASLESSIRLSERFIKKRTEYLRDISTKIMKEIPNARLYDGDIFRLFGAEKDKKYLDKLIKDNFISSSQANVYNQILSSSHWPILKAKWNKLRSDADKEFSKPVAMKVYDATTGGEKSVTMSPRDSIKYYQKHMQIGSVAVDPRTGEVKAWVGGTNHKYFQYDHVTSNRQVGSTFKPFIYGTAIIDQAMSPCYKVVDTKYCIPAGDPNFKLTKDWCPSNSDKNTGIAYTLKEALKLSKNSVSVYLMKEIGSVARVRKFVSELGIDPAKIPEGPAICLGTAELSALDMATAYTAFANNGTMSKPYFVSRIEDRNGKLIYQAVPEQKAVINPSYNYVLVDMLKHVADILKGRFPKTGDKVGGKTGTTNDYKDGWYVGFTPNIVVATWAGGDMPWIRFNRIEDGQGSVMARPMFERLIQACEKDPKVKWDYSRDFAIPAEQLIELDCSKYVNNRPSGDVIDVKVQKVDEIGDDEFQ